MTSLVLTALVALGAPSASGSPAPAKAETAPVAPSATKADLAAPVPAKPPVDGGSLWPGRKINDEPLDDTLPNATLTDSERQAAAAAALARLDNEERSWTGQLIRTIFSLLAVIALIYLIFKVAVPKLLGVSLPGKTSKSLKVVERTQLDARHAVVLIEIDKQRFLIGTGEHGIQLLADLSRPGAATATGRSDFQATLERAAGGSIDEDTHAKG